MLTSLAINVQTLHVTGQEQSWTDHSFIFASSRQWFKAMYMR